MSDNDLKALQIQVQQLMRQHTEQAKELAEQKTKYEEQAKKHEELAETVEKEVVVIKVMLSRTDGFVDEMISKVRDLESKLIRLTEHEAALLVRLSEDFRRETYAIVREGVSSINGKPAR